jgi:protease-4|tara:strand:- start:2706 stop:4541 length:1836 start_codon:yes stop_codon:yes gene_type:complete
MEQKTFFEKFKKNPLFWIFSGQLFFLSLNVIFLIALLIGVISFISSIFMDEFDDPTDKALVIRPLGPIVEQVAGSDDPFDNLSGDLPRELYVGDLLEVLETAASDDRVQDIILSLDNINGTGQAVLYDVGNALQKIQEADKNIIAVGDYFTRSGYYLASFADEIIMNSDGLVEMDGFGRSRLFYKSFLDKIKVDFNVFRVGTFKSAVEPYLGNEMSEAAKEANLAYLDVLWSSYKDVISKNRGMTSEEIQYLVDNSDSILTEEGLSSSEAILNYGLVDKLLPRTKTRSYLKELFGESDDKKSFAQISGYEYFRLIQSEKSVVSAEDKIAVVVARGTIVNGVQPPGTIGGDSTSRLIREAHEDENVKAIVLRVDSGGGGVFASEQIRLELLEAKEKGLTIIASMGNVAASGGYWISANAHEIWASHNTITGSIGIFGILPTIDRALSEIGINSDGVKTSRLDLSGDVTSPLDEGLSKIIQSEIEYGYKRFIGLVSQARNIPIEEVDKIAQGRVWAGSTALELGLVDNIGNLQMAIKRAAELAEIDEYNSYYPEQEVNWREQIFNRLSGYIGWAIPSLIKENILVKETVRVLQDIEKLNDPKGIYIICEDCQI